MNKQTIVSVVASVILSTIVALIIVSNYTPMSFAGFTRQSSLNLIPVESTDGFSIGTTTNASLITYMGGGTCSLVSDASIAATSTGSGTCATTGSQVGDIVIIGPFATTTTKIAAQYSIIGALAGSNTSSVRLLNLTGTAAVPSATNGLGSSTPYRIYRIATPSSDIFNR
jgi:hypothetical protein